MSYFCEEWTAHGCQRLLMLAFLTVIVCLLLDCNWFKTTIVPRITRWYASLLEWTREQLCSMCLRVADHLKKPPPPPTPPSPPPSPPPILNESPPPPSVFSSPPSPLTNRVDSAISLMEAEPKQQQQHTLYVCTKCTRKCKVEVSSPQECRMGTGDAPLVDMEDLLPQPKPKTGRILYDKLLERHNQVDSPTHAVQDVVQIVPVGCLSSCDRGNSIAVGALGKYTYQFGDLVETDAEQLEDVLHFVRQWVDSSDGFSKSRTRPKRMRSNALARVPPLQECTINKRDCAIPQ